MSLALTDKSSEAMQPAVTTHSRHTLPDVADDFATTVPVLLNAVGTAMQRPARLLPAPLDWLRAGARIARRLPQIDRLTAELRPDASNLALTQDWRAPVSQHDAIAETTHWYLSAR